MSRVLLLIFSLCFAASLCAQNKPVAKPPAKIKNSTKTAAKKPAPNAIPPGYEKAKFVLPPAPYGSWLNLQYPETTAPRWQPRGIVFLPKGSTNIAFRKPVTSSDDLPIIGSLGFVTDGVKEGTEGHWIELGPGTQWVQIDLQAKYDLHGVLLWHYFGQPNRVYRDVIVRLADDAAFTQNVRTVYNNDQDNSSGLGVGSEREFYEHNSGQWIPFKTQTARYVRLYSRGNTADPQNQYIEAEVWASPVKNAPKSQNLHAK